MLDESDLNLALASVGFRRVDAPEPVWPSYEDDHGSQVLLDIERITGPKGHLLIDILCQDLEVQGDHIGRPALMDDVFGALAEILIGPNENGST